MENYIEFVGFNSKLKFRQIRPYTILKSLFLKTVCDVILSNSYSICLDLII